MSNPTIELISFKLCPFVQRSVITLLKKNVEFKITYVDLANKPDWFLAISPLGKVPVVKYGEEVLFESAIINEFLDEITPNPLMPNEPLQKAKDRAWIEFSSQTIMSQYLMSVAKNQEDFEKHSANLTGLLAKLEDVKGDEPYFGGEAFSLVDTAITPLLTRFNATKAALGKDFLAPYKKLSALAEKVAQLDYVKKSVVPEFDELYIEYLTNNDSYLAKNP